MSDFQAIADRVEIEALRSEGGSWLSPRLFVSFGRQDDQN
jgi:hypothetical protein